MKTVEAQHVRGILANHFPEWLSGYCSCGVGIETCYSVWLDHITLLLEESNVPQEDSAL